ncbi:MAG: hypothetical protein AAGM84_08185 [Pseudomonadota bacterium]
MALIHTDQNFGVIDRVWTAIRNTFATIGASVNLAAAADARMAEIEALNAKSDAELARLGLSREEIPSHVFRDLIHI